MAITIIGGNVDHGIVLDQGNYGATLTVSHTGKINAPTYGIYGAISNADVVNDGSIHAGLVAVDLEINATLENIGAISAATFGVALRTSGILVNSGTISAVSQYAVGLVSFGSIKNSGLITSKYVGVVLTTENTLDNTGIIYGASIAIATGAANSMFNSGTIAGGGHYAVGLGTNTSLDNTGFISATNAGIVLRDGTLANAGGIHAGEIGAYVVEGALINSGAIYGKTIGLEFAGSTTQTVFGAIFVNDVTNATAGSITSGGIGVVLRGGQSAAPVSLDNAGSIIGGVSGAYVHSANLTNIGDISGAVGIALDIGSIYNEGTISGSSAGGYIEGGLLTNTGLIEGRDTGITLVNALATNTGTISGGTYGVYLNGGGLLDTGTVAGGSFAVYGTAAFTLNLEPTADLAGKVKDRSGTGTLIFSGAAAGSLSGLGTSITGFSNLNFSPRADWTVEGNLAGFTGGVTITNFNESYFNQAGFYAGNTIVITDFAASAGYYRGGADLTLSNGAATEILSFNTLGTSGRTVAVYEANGKTYLIADELDQRVSFSLTPGAATLVNTLTNFSVTPGEGNDALGITIASTGTIDTTDAPAIVVPRLVSGVNVVNFGLVESSLVYSAVAFKGSGIVTNFGTIIGGADADTLINSGLVKGAASAVTLTNSGTILGAAYGSYVTNTGLIACNVSDDAGVVIGAQGGAFFGDSSDITGLSAGVFASSYGTLAIHNFGKVHGGFAGVEFSGDHYGDGPIFDNYGSVGGGDGFYSHFGGTILNAGTISGASYAIDFENQEVGEASPLHLIIEAGAVFIGAVHDVSKRAQLTLGGTTPGSLNIGSSFSGFSTINFSAVASWTLEGALDDLASGQTIGGFTTGDTLILDGFSAASSSFVLGTGIVLSNGSRHETIGLKGNFSADPLTVTAIAGGTEIVAPETIGLIDTISTRFAARVTPGAAAYGSNLTITRTGGIIAPAYQAAIYVAPSLTGVMLSNAGVIEGGAVFKSDALVLNSGTIIGGYQGLYFKDRGLVTNSGTVIGGIKIDQGGRIDNSGNIYSDAFGIELFNGGTVTNSGTIGGGTYGGAISDAGGVLELTVKPGAVFNGSVYDVSHQGQLTLGGNTAGRLDMGTSFIGFSSIDFAVGSKWLLEGAANDLAGGQTITGFSLGDTIKLDGFNAASHSYVAGSGLVLFNGQTTETLDIIGNFSPTAFSVTANAAGTEILLCYLRGTKILTAVGEIPVEGLKIGDPVITRFHGYRPIKWIGRQSYARRFVNHNREQIPVKIAAGALGQNLPWRNLFVSPGHSMLIGGVLVLAKALVNGVTITQEDMPEEIHYYQVEFDTHDCVLAEGAWSESYGDTPGLRNKFHNVADFFKMYPDYQEPAMQHLCAPRPEQGALLEGALRPITGRACAGVKPGALRGWVDHAHTKVVEGWAQDADYPDLPVLLEVLVGNHVAGTVLACGYRDDLAKAGLGQGWCHFSFALPVNLPLKTRRTIRVRRAADGAEIHLSDACKAELGLKLIHPPSKKSLRAG